MSALGLVLAAALAAPMTPAPAAPAAREPPPPASPGLEGTPVRVERRLLVKSRHFFLTLGADYFIRGDYYVNPGLLASASYYWSETSGVDVKLGGFFSFLSPAAEEVFEAVRLVPDAHRPVGLLVGGYRHSVGYGKVMLSGAPASLLHFDVQVAAHAGMVFTDRMVSPAVGVAPGLLVRFNERWFAQLDVELYASIETRTYGWLALGLLPTLVVGVVL